MSLPFAPPPGLPIPVLDPSVRDKLIFEFQPTSIEPWFLPVLALVTLLSYFIFELWKKFRPVKKEKQTWQEQYLDPKLGEKSAPLTTTEILTKLFQKDRDLAIEAEPLLHELDLAQYSTSQESLGNLVDKTKNLFIKYETLVNKKESL